MAENNIPLPREKPPVPEPLPGYTETHPLIQAIIMAESRGNPKARSQKGARGEMQLMPKTARTLHGSTNIEKGVNYFNQLYQRFGSEPDALLAYNMGPTATARWIKEGRNYNDLPRESQGYLDKVWGHLEKNETPANVPAQDFYKPMPSEEQLFQRGIRNTGWFKEYVKQYGEEPDLNTKDYNYRAAWKAGLRPDARDPGDNQYHWPSSLPDGTMLKAEDHPTAWKEYYMREYGTNPDEAGITKDKYDALQQTKRWLTGVP